MPRPIPVPPNPPTPPAPPNPPTPPPPEPTPQPPAPTPPLVVTASTPMRSIGDLPRAAWVKELQGSPMAAELDDIMAAASPYGALCLCQAKRESSYGRDANAQAAHNAWGIMPNWGTLKRFSSWDLGAGYFSLLLANEDVYPPHDISMLDYVRTYVGGPQCRTSGGKTCADPNAAGPNPAYLVSLLADLNALIGGTTPAPQPQPHPDIDPIRIIVGGGYPPITYGWLADVGLHYYAYGVGHGTQRDTQHTGVDVPVARGTALFAPVSGVVDCVGDAGTPRWGEGCGAYPDTDGSGASGNLTILLDSGHKLVLGHCSAFLVNVGQRVTAGQQVARSGGMNGPHCHVEVAINKGGTYWLVEPTQALKDAMGGVAPAVYAERVPIPPVDDTPPYWVVRVTADSLPVLQRGDMNAPPVAPPLGKGETFFAQYTLPGTDGKGYWVSTQLGRVPMTGTEISEVTLP